MNRTLTTAVGAVAIACLAIRGGTASAQSLETGELKLVGVDGDPIEGGGSTTPFTLRLPRGAECPGDSADDNYRVNSYMVPAAVEPQDVAFDGLGPKPTGYGPGKEFRQPLYDTATTFFVSIQTEDAEAPGDPGKILELPNFAFGVFRPGDVPAGRYHVGLACTLINEIERVWDAQIDVVEDPGDQPAQIHWSVVGFEPSDGSSPPYLALGVGAAAALAVSVVLLRRRSPAR